MPFVKLDCGILNSTIWYERDCREVFLTALLLAEPKEFTQEQEVLETEDLKPTGWKIPPGWYGFVRAAGPGIVRRSMLDDEPGMAALKKLCQPEPESRSSEYGGRRLARVNGGYVVLNYMKYRDYDYTAADRMRRMRERRKAAVTPNVDDVHPNVTPVHPNVTHAESREQIAEAELEKPPARSRSHPPGGSKARPEGLDAVRAYWSEANLSGKPDEFYDHFVALGWRMRSGDMKDWRAAARNWSRRDPEFKRPTATTGVPRRAANFDDLEREEP